MRNRIVLAVSRFEVIMIEQDSAHIFYRPYFVDDVNHDGNMVCTAFSMTIHEPYRHALTRHDSKTYVP